MPETLSLRWIFGGTKEQCREVKKSLNAGDFLHVELAVERHKRGGCHSVFITGPCDPLTEEKLKAYGQDFIKHFMEEERVGPNPRTG